jgi:hypothetical protein
MCACVSIYTYLLIPWVVLISQIIKFLLGGPTRGALKARGEELEFSPFGWVDGEGADLATVGGEGGLCFVCVCERERKRERERERGEGRSAYIFTHTHTHTHTLTHLLLLFHLLLPLLPLPHHPLFPLPLVPRL